MPNRGICLSKLLATLLAILCIPTATRANDIPTALDDTADHLGYTFTVDVLANDLEPDGEALDLTLGFATCSHAGDSISAEVVEGLVRIQGSGASLSANCSVPYTLEDEKGFTSSATLTLLPLAPLFVDGFESGTTNAWSDTVIDETGAPQ